MTGNIAIDVAIGLVFIYLLYSLLATIVQELIAQAISLRARTLVHGIRVMLEDRHEDYNSKWAIVNFMARMFTAIRNNIRFAYCLFPENTLARKFYSQPTIKYLSSSSWSSKPSYIGPSNFSETIIRLLRSKEYDGNQSQYEMIAATLAKWKAQFDDVVARNQGFIIVELDGDPVKIGPETLDQLNQLLIDAQKDVDRYKALLEQWYDSTMQRVMGWYKRQTQLCLLVIGLIMAWSFNVDTIAIYKVLAKDKKARDAMVEIAIAQQPKMQVIIDSLDARKQRNNDSVVYVNSESWYLDTTYASLTQAAWDANEVMGLGKPYKDSINKYCPISAAFKTNKKDTLTEGDTTYVYPDSGFAVITITGKRIKLTEAEVDQRLAFYKREVSNLRYNSKQTGRTSTLFGWLITALALSLGAPFWFDLLNKLVQLRAAGKKPEPSTSKASTDNDNSGTGISRDNTKG